MRTRFAPSPTGPLHLGHAFSALIAAEMAKATQGTFLLRIEDIDQSRARATWEQQIFDDLHWLGLSWPLPVMRQSERLSAYDSALDQLWDQGLLYPCTCSRRDIAQALNAPQEGDPVYGPDGLVYPGTCRHIPTGSRPKTAVLRLNMQHALAQIGDTPIAYHETGEQPGRKHVDQITLLESVGDVVLARRGMGTSYHLSVVVDDADQEISHVVRGADLADATAIHVVLQRLLNKPTPIYHHHRLIRDADGKRLAKRDDARAISLYRDEGRSAGEIAQMVGLTPLAT